MTHLDVPRPPGRLGWRTELAGRAELHGWRVHALGAEWEPDFLLVRRPHLLWIFAEPPRGKLSKPRFASFVELRACGQQVHIWHPDDIEKIGRILS